MAPPSASPTVTAASTVPQPPPERIDTTFSHHSSSAVDSTYSTPHTSTTTTTITTLAHERTPVTPSPTLADRIRVAEHRFTSLTQNIAHFSPLKIQLDKHNLAIERLENEIKKKTALLQSCQDRLKSISKRPQTSSRQGSSVSLHASEDAEYGALVSQQQSSREELESLNGQLLAAKILHIGLTRQVTQYFESRSELQALLEEIFSGSTPEHPSEDALERELERITAEIQQVKEDFEKHRLAKNEFKEIRRYVDIWNEAVEKQVASNAKDVTKTFKKFVPFFGPKPPSYTKIADAHLANARTYVPTLDDFGLLSEIKMDTIADTSSELIIYTARFKDAYNGLSHQLEVLHKKSRVLKKKRNQWIEKLFDERCKIFSEELQAHYRSIGESLVSEDGGGLAGMGASAGYAAMAAFNGSGIGSSSGLRMGLRQHVEGNMESYSSEGSSSLGHNSQELLLEVEELPSYFQHEHEASAHHHQHRRTFSLGSPARSSSASSSLSLHSPLPIHATTATDSPPDYVRDEHQVVMGGLSAGTGLGSGGFAGSAGSGAHHGEDEDAQFRAYHQRYDTTTTQRQRQSSDPRRRSLLGMNVTTLNTTTPTTSAMDMPPGYEEETRHHSVVDPV